MRLRMATESELRWDDLSLFLAAHRAGSLTRAAAKLGLNQSTMSRRLASFEETIGGTLFDRTPDGLVPTALADRLLGPAERAEEAAHDAARVVFDREPGVEGDVRLAVADGMADFVLAPRLAELRERHPGLRVTLFVSDALADLTRREADIGLRFVRPSRGDLVARCLFAGGYAVFGAPDFVSALGPGPHPLAGLPFVGWDPETQGHFPECGWEARSGVRVVGRATTLTARIRMAQAGVGAIQLVGDWGDRLPGLARIDTAEIALSSEVWLVTHRALRDVPRIRAVWRFVEACLQALVDG